MSAAHSRTRPGRFLAGLAVSALLWAPLAPALAAEHDPVRVRISAALLDEEIRTLLPARLALPRALAELAEEGATTMTLAELRYCGATEKGAGRFRAVIRPNAAGGAQAILTTGDGCQHGLAELAKRGGSTGDAKDGPVMEPILADIEVTWKSWLVKLTVAHALIAGRKGATSYDKRVDILTIPTSDLRINLDPGAPIVLHVVPAFTATAIDFAVAMTEGPPPKAVTLERVAASPRGEMLSGQANIAAEVPLQVANQVLRLLTWGQPLTIPVDRDEIEIRQAVLAGSGAGQSARLMVSGTAMPRSIRETMQWTLTLGGEPLVVSTAQFSGQSEDCAGLGALAALGCNVRNGARGAAAEAFGSTAKLA